MVCGARALVGSDASTTRTRCSWLSCRRYVHTKLLINVQQSTFPPDGSAAGVRRPQVPLHAETHSAQDGPTLDLTVLVLLLSTPYFVLALNGTRTWCTDLLPLFALARASDAVRARDNPGALVPFVLVSRVSFGFCLSLRWHGSLTCLGVSFLLSFFLFLLPVFFFALP